MLTHRSAPHPATIATPTGGTASKLALGGGMASVYSRRIVIRTTKRAGAASPIVKILAHDV